MPDQLDAFLTDGSQPAAAPEPTPADRPPASTPETKPETDRPAEAPAKPRELDEEHDQLLSGTTTDTVPFATLEKVRRDWKSKYAAEQARTEELRRQLEEAKRVAAAPSQAPAVPQQQFAPAPDVTTDPLGWARHLEARHQQMLVNERLNMSEAMVSQTLPKEKLDQYVADFRQAAARDPSLWGKLYSKPSPYHWLTAEIDRLRMQNEIGDDPTAWRSKIVAEERAKWEAEARGAAPSPAAGLPPSLANARSVAGRTTSTFTGPPDMGDILRRPDKRAR